MLAVTTDCAPAAIAPTGLVVTVCPSSVKATSVAADALVPMFLTVAVRVMASDSSGDTGVAVTPVTVRSGLDAGVP
ncbi:hypothetical protein D3C74_488350 [compost metagenome]